MKFKLLHHPASGAAVPAVSAGVSPAVGLRTSHGRDARRSQAGRLRHCAAFTLAEVLAALAFMAIVIPVAIEGMRTANLAGQVGLRKAVAGRVADRVLNEWLVGQSQGAAQNGTVQEGGMSYQWSIRVQTWNQDSMRVATATVDYKVQGNSYDVQLSTLLSNR